MADHRAGFTLVEMLAAIAILSFGLTSLVAVLGVGVDTRSSAELRDRAVRALDVVMVDVEHRVLAQIDAQGEEPEDLFPLEYEPIPGFPRLRAEVQRAMSEVEPDSVLLSIRITWVEEGVTVGETFQKIMSRAASFPARVGRLRSRS